MQKITLFVAMICFVSIAKSQQTYSTVNPFPKTITVSGSAEMEIIPDQIYVNIQLREYQKKGDAKKDLETIKQQFIASCKEVGLVDSAISISSFSGFNNYYSFKKKRKDPNLTAAIVYQIIFNDSKTMDALVEKLDDEATESFIIASASHSKMSEFRKQLKIKAMKAAKDKAVYLTEAIGEHVGSAITITEPEEPGGYDTRNNAYQLSNTVSQVGGYLNEDAVGKAGEINFKKIKLRYEVSAVFSLN